MPPMPETGMPAVSGRAADLGHHVQRDRLDRRAAVAAVRAHAAGRRADRQGRGIDAHDRVDGVDQRHRVGAAALGGRRRLADVGDVGRQLDDHRQPAVLLAPRRDHLDVFGHLAHRRAHAALAHAVRAAEVELDAVGAGVLDPRQDRLPRALRCSGTISETTSARSGQRRLTSAISSRLICSGRSVMSSMLLKPSMRRSA